MRVVISVGENVHVSMPLTIVAIASDLDDCDGPPDPPAPRRLLSQTPIGADEPVDHGGERFPAMIEGQRQEA